MDCSLQIPNKNILPNFLPPPVRKHSQQFVLLGFGHLLCSSYSGDLLSVATEFGRAARYIQFCWRFFLLSFWIDITTFMIIAGNFGFDLLMTHLQTTFPLFLTQNDEIVVNFVLLSKWRQFIDLEYEINKLFSYNQNFFLLNLIFLCSNKGKKINDNLIFKFAFLFLFQTISIFRFLIGFPFHSWVNYYLNLLAFYILFTSPSIAHSIGC